MRKYIYMERGKKKKKNEKRSAICGWRVISVVHCSTVLSSMTLILFLFETPLSSFIYMRILRFTHSSCACISPTLSNSNPFANLHCTAHHQV
ncbi:hypothetical protein MANES_14G011350v8 [Manihot esculenta]|uniref:Uncharacterized protein n=1 Tax=Manihot esculenta TaxID=3983 RepID=A0ACB7GCZ9_MANES|nr:hypothetical protein MANES_14G011350v8 [Manihot esculenta]